MNIFGTVLTHVAPTSNYRGERDLNRLVLQRITRGRFEYAVMSPEAIRNAMRETLRGYRVPSMPSNRERLHNEIGLAVRYVDYPDPQKYADDFFFGYMVAKRGDIPPGVAKERDFQYKRDSVLRVNLAVALEPYRHDALLTQSPLTVKNSQAPWQNADTSALLHREVSVTAFQYPFAINEDDCMLGEERHKGWLRHLLRAVSELNNVAGGHARSYFEMAPASIAVRRTTRLVAGYDLYGFRGDGSLPEIVNGILEGDYPGNEFILGGQLVRELLPEETHALLKEKGVSLHRTGAQALNHLAKAVTGKGFLPDGVNG